jgi:predicted ATP-dependent serine protease
MKEAEKLGFKRCVVPKSGRREESFEIGDIELLKCRTLKDALDVALLTV